MDRAIPFLQVDAFASRPFEGNPAAVVLLDEPAPDAWMQSVAAEMNLSETAFVHPAGDGAWRLRWFTPTTEVKLCGHATLASAHALWEWGKLRADEAACFDTLSGRLECRRRGDDIAMDFPAIPVERATPSTGLRALFGGIHLMGAARSSMGWIAEVESESVLRALHPEMGLVVAAGPKDVGLIVTAPGGPGTDFCSRFFAPQSGVDEDPVTGSAHCALAVYWSSKTGRTRMTGFQASRRGGRVGMLLHGERVELAGQAVTMLEGQLRA
jgi:predicted PhzF superfamily epimerase YddE/YHI9